MSLGMNSRPSSTPKIVWRTHEKESTCSTDTSITSGMDSDWSKWSFFSALSVFSVGSLLAVGGILSFVGAACAGSTLSILSIGSSFSILSVGSVASVLSIGSSNCYMGYYEDCRHYKLHDSSDLAMITVSNFVLSSIAVLIVKIVGWCLKKRLPEPKVSTGRPPHLRNRELVRRVENC